MLEKELNKLRVKRAERERELGAARLRESSRTSPAQQTNSNTLATQAVPKSVQTPTPADSTTVNNTTVKEEKLASDNLSNSTDIEVKYTVLKELSAVTGENQTKKAPQELDLKVDGADTELGTSTLAQLPDDDDFDSMFADTTVNAGDAGDTVDFDFDFSTDVNTSQDLLGNNDLGDLTTASNTFNTANASSSEDINSLLPGLGDYVNVDADGADDFAMIDLPAEDPSFNAAPTSTPNAQKLATSSASATATATATQDLMDTNIDTDMFFGTDGAMDDFNEDWFNDL